MLNNFKQRVAFICIYYIPYTYILESQFEIFFLWLPQQQKKTITWNKYTIRCLDVCIRILRRDKYLLYFLRKKYIAHAISRGRCYHRTHLFYNHHHHRTVFCVQQTYTTFVQKNILKQIYCKQQKALCVVRVVTAVINAYRELYTISWRESVLISNLMIQR